MGTEAWLSLPRKGEEVLPGGEPFLVTASRIVVRHDASLLPQDRLWEAIPRSHLWDSHLWSGNGLSVTEEVGLTFFRTRVIHIR